MKSCIFGMILFFGNTVMYGQEFSFSMEIDRDTVKQGEVIQVTYQLEGAGGTIQAPDFEDMTVVGGPNVSSSMSMINGVVEQSYSHSYVLYMTEPGLIDIPVATVVIDGEQYSTPASSVLVIEDPNWDPGEAPAQRREKKLKKKNDKVIRI